MPITLFQKDPFTEAELQSDASSYNATYYNVRRPFLGIDVKDPRFAFISLYQDLGDGNRAQVISLIDSSAPGGFSDANHNFILQTVTESRQEKVQIVETFGDHFAFFYGQKPIVLGVRGILFNADNFNWKNEFLANYERFLRGTKCVENKTRVFLGWDDVLAQGYLLNVSITYDKDMPNVVPFSFNMLLAKPPLDLSNASAPLDSPNPGSEKPYQYRSYEFAEADRAANDAIESATDIRPPDLSPEQLYPEYTVGGAVSAGRVLKSDLVTFGTDGQPVIVSGANGNAAATTDGGGERTAFWVNGTNAATKQWRDKDEALLALNASLTAQQTGSDPVTTVLALRRDASSFQLGSRDAALETILQSLGTGVANSAAVVPDAPDVE